MMWYIFEKEIIQGPQKQCSQVKNKNLENLENLENQKKKKNNNKIKKIQPHFGWLNWEIEGFWLSVSIHSVQIIETAVNYWLIFWLN